MPESFASKRLRWLFNIFPAYRGTGAKVLYVADDFREVRIRLPLSWRTRNAVRTIFGGSMYGAVDPFFMIMLMKLLGPGYVVWDKSATIRFRRPGRSALFATFRVDKPEVEAILAATAAGAPVDRIYNVDLTDREGVVHASVEKVVYVKRKNAETVSSGV